MYSCLPCIIFLPFPPCILYGDFSSLVTLFILYVAFIFFLVSPFVSVLFSVSFLLRWSLYTVYIPAPCFRCNLFLLFALFPSYYNSYGSCDFSFLSRVCYSRRVIVITSFYSVPVVDSPVLYPLCILHSFLNLYLIFVLPFFLSFPLGVNFCLSPFSLPDPQFSSLFSYCYPLPFMLL